MELLLFQMEKKMNVKGLKMLSKCLSFSGNSDCDFRIPSFAGKLGNPLEVNAYWSWDRWQAPYIGLSLVPAKESLVVDKGILESQVMGGITLSYVVLLLSYLCTTHNRKSC